MQKILIVEDNEDLRSLLAVHLDKHGFQTMATVQFERVLGDFLEGKPDLVLLDINLPSFDGYYWCRQIRQHSTCPIIFISAREGTMDQIMALDNGADDFITKPFSYEMVTAKVRSHLRRAYGEYAATVGERVVHFHGLTYVIEKMELQFQAQSIELSKKEASLLEVLLERGDKVTSRDRLMEKMWDTDMYVDENTLNVYMTRVRKKLSELGIHDAIETVRGAGYRMKLTWIKPE
ncbi:response regulator transcription factor [Paenibacillus sp. SYP-B3998]|uniref:Response regulator transcription factor n=1 Tax=Paenibacillus sp. SYP-B3998 TaxID=2678564 RepID=A0A6G4A587_9BACL|nr:response regulator transcription factor [Paenibacillus sp. SYP-B3998]NEW08969.1 response regulator transcription factor [Paenibacillus sp. SYP-B3998]